MSRLEAEAKPVILALAGAGRDATRLVLTRVGARTLARWAQKTAITCELTGDAPFSIGTVAMGQRLRGGFPLRGSMVWVARNAVDFWPATAHAHATIGATPRPVPGEQDRHALLTMIVWRHLTLMVFIAGGHGNLPALVPPPVALDRWTRMWSAAGPEYPQPVTVDGTADQDDGRPAGLVPAQQHRRFREIPVPAADHLTGADLPCRRVDALGFDLEPSAAAGPSTVRCGPEQH